jgi:hypothetical protein
MSDPFNPPRGPRVAIRRDYMMGMGICIAMDFGGDTMRVMHFGENGVEEWREYGRFVIVDEPTFRLQEEMARELYAELGRFFQGAPDITTSRADYLHMRTRIDKLTDDLVEIAKGALYIDQQ